MSIFEVLTLLVGLVAVVISVTSLVCTRRVQVEQLELQRTTAALAKKQLEIIIREENSSNNAHIDISIEQHTNAHKFVVTNVGQGVAKEVSFSVEPHGKGDNPIIESDYREKIPIPILKPGGSVGILAAFSMGDATAFDVVLSWKNSNGNMIEDQTFVSL